jgi:hypothetical protein
MNGAPHPVGVLAAEIQSLLDQFSREAGPRIA